jgi:hypothetical protein
MIMKKFLLYGLSLGIGISVYAQNAVIKNDRINPVVANKAIPVKKATLGDNLLIAAPNPTVVAHKSSSGVTIGTTFYDLMANYGTIGNRLNVFSDFTAAAVWTMSYSGAAGFPDRGTGYNYYNGTAWGPNPTAIVETARKGWPSITSDGTGGEFLVSHTGIWINKRPVKGTGTWVESKDSLIGIVWPRAASGGANGQTIHLIGNNQGTVNAIRYSRSLNGGTSFDKQDVIVPGTDSTKFGDWQADNYAIDARGDVVAFVMGGWFSDFTLFKSLDNGNTWTMTDVKKFPIPVYAPTLMISDTNSDGVADTILTADAAHVLIDNNNQVHVWYGGIRVLDDDTANAGSWFPGTDGLYYWNESMLPNVGGKLIAEALDRDSDGKITIDPDIANYQCGLTSMPTAGIDANGNIYLAYSSIQENTSNGAATAPQSYRNVYLMHTTNGGTTWSTPVNISNSDFDEGVYPALGRRVGTKVHLMWMQDGEPGTSVGQDADPVAQNEMIHQALPSLTGIDSPVNNLKNVNLYPNPANNIARLLFNVVEPTSLTINISNLIGQTISSSVFDASQSGVFSFDINVNTLPSGMYMVNIINGSSITSKKLIVR